MKGHRHLTIVIKLGTSSIVDEKTHEPLLSILTLIVETAVKLRKDGHKVVIVSSGAIGVGLRRMDVERRPKHLSKLQALAAIGQCQLMTMWDTLFTHLRQPIAQVLITRNDIGDRTRYLNAQNTVMELLDMGVIPIVNENDTLAVAEIKFGDNDTLSAITGAMVHADMLFLMTDVDCLYDKNPRAHPDAQPIEVVEDIGALQADGKTFFSPSEPMLFRFQRKTLLTLLTVSTAGSSLGTGGMSTKIVAARLATSAGVTTVITRASNPGNILKIVRHIQATRTPPITRNSSRDHLHHHNHNHHHHPHHQNQNAAAAAAADSNSSGEDPLSRSTASLDITGTSTTPPPLHTRFLPSTDPIRDRSFWILHGLRPHGTIYVDAGCHRALADKAGLLPVGVVDVEGSFAQQEAVRICVVEKRVPNPAPPGTGTGTGPLWEGSCLEVGRALVNYSSAEIARIKGRQSTEIGRLLGYADSEYVAQREYISLFRRESRPATPSRELEERILGAGAGGGVAGYESNAVVPPQDGA
ncbi:uncharacterized protein E0L32_009000 [Thyridium curvatum]|uniref:PUA domain-containing protein n=1 Tax=Thyridium curvatum TaxID=1093900 RepID=A0A507AXT1_9PEZI|nr:uncharacterized protein E0L32_009000 [Thyridium curvatum]TPX09809.1 hypothetical protein E0L32_009000 [Thyridium curvatum]